MKHLLDVVGMTWGNGRAAYRYPVTPEQASGLIANLIEPDRLAGDFQSVEDWRLTETTRAFQIGRDFRRELVEERRLRNWKDRKNARMFARNI